MKSMQILLSVITIFYITKTISSQEESEPVLEMDQAEKDKIMACTEIVSAVFRRDQKIIEDISSQIKGSADRDRVGNKVSGDMLSKCYHTIEENQVKLIFNDGVFQDPSVSQDLLSLGEVDYSRFKGQENVDLELSPETQLLFYKLEKAKEEYMQRMREKTERSRNTLSIFGYDLMNLPVGFNIVFSIVIMSAMIGGILYMLKSLQKEEKVSSKKKKRRQEKED